MSGFVTIQTKLWTKSTSDEDWKDVKLSVVSGRPISFISLLDTPRYGQRQIAELPEDRAAGPVVYGGSISGSGVGGGTSAKKKPHLNANAPSAGEIGGVLGQVPAAQQSVTVDAVQGTVEGATGPRSANCSNIVSLIPSRSKRTSRQCFPSFKIKSRRENF